MTKQTKAKTSATKLPCLWAEEKGFEVVPKQPPAKEQQGLGPDTAFLLKSKSSPRPRQFPSS
jgi:hypothetical protein